MIAPVAGADRLVMAHTSGTPIDLIGRARRRGFSSTVSYHNVRRTCNRSEQGNAVWLLPKLPPEGAAAARR